MRVLFLETYYGGSHKSFLDGLAKYSRHEIVPITLPSRFWKWRLRGSALYLAQEYAGTIREANVLFVTDMIDLATLKALANYQCPAVMFFHENQLSYPLPDGDNLDLRLGFVNLTSALVADRCLFNSKYQLEQFDFESKRFINDIPEFAPDRAHDEIMKRSQVIYMGIDFSAFRHPPVLDNPTPVVLWNHRWEFDKQPEVFFRLLYKLDAEGVPFQIIILGENFQMQPKEFLEARERLGHRIIQFGFVESMDDYSRFLANSDIVISTAIQENFGFAVTEAMFCHTLPLLPNRLSYPEILPRGFHDQFLYHSEEELEAKLRRLLRDYRQMAEVKKSLAESMRQFDWKSRIDEFDALFDNLVGQKRRAATRRRGKNR